MEVLAHVTVMSLISGDVDILIAFRIPHTINPLSHRRFLLVEMVDHTSDPVVRGAQGQYKFAARKLPIQFFVKNRPGIVLKCIKPVREIECHFVHLFPDIRIIHPVRPSNPVTQVTQCMGQ